MHNLTNIIILGFVSEMPFTIWLACYLNGEEEVRLTKLKVDSS